MKPSWVVWSGFSSALLLGGAFGCSSDTEAGGGAFGGAGALTGGSIGTGGARSSGGNPAGGGGTAGSSSANGGSSMAGSPATGGASTAQTGGKTGTMAGGAGGKTSGGGSAGAGTAGAGTAGANNGGAGSPTGGVAGSGTMNAGGTASAGAGPVGGAAGNGGAGGAPNPTDCKSDASVITYPALPGASKSALYTVTANGATQFVERMTKFAPEMQVHYAYFGVAKGCTANVSVTLSENFSSYKLSPKSRNLSATKNGNVLTFSSGPNYLILQADSKELLFILIDEEESNPPKVGDANVKSIAEYEVDNTGAALVTSKVQSAINAASGATQNILYFPPGRYKVGELSMKSNMTLYLAAGAILDGSTKTGDYGAAGPAVENTSHGVVHFNNVQNAQILGRGVIDGNGAVIRGNSNETPSFKTNVVRIDQSSKIVIDGILARDPVFWNTLIYKSDQVTIRNYKVINRRPTTTTYNQTDGVDFDASTNGNLYNAFLYTGDDPMATKTEQEGGIDTKNIVHEKVVAYSNSAACKVGTKTFGKTMDGIVFRDIDIVKSGRGLVIDANDTAVIQNTKYENIRVEAIDSTLIDIEEDRAPDWRTAPNTATVRDLYFTNVSSDVKKPVNIHGKSSSVNISGVYFKGFTVQGKEVTSQTDADASWNINQYVSNIKFE